VDDTFHVMTLREAVINEVVIAKRHPERSSCAARMEFHPPQYNQQSQNKQRKAYGLFAFEERVFA
jgi:hypothetical protein